MTEVRVMTYNIFMGGRKGSSLHDVVRTVAPDVLLVNESPKTPILWKRQCQRLAGKWQMDFIIGGRPAGSNMIAISDRVRVKKAEARVLKQPLFQPRRGIASAQLRAGGKLFGVVSCHLSLDRERRLREVEEVLGTASGLRGPVVIAGDLNERPDGPVWKRLRDVGFHDAGTKDWKTFPAAEPTARIDALLVRGSATVLHHGDPGVPLELQAAASDHRAVLAVLDI